VEFFGRVNYGHTIDRKGLTNIRIHTQTLFDWEIYNEPLTDLTEARLGKTAERGNTSPKFFVGQFSAEEKQDLLFDTSKYTNGYVWVNGFNLGRFKGKKPKQALYIPAPLIKGGKNEIIIFDFQK
ncbi:MAG: beta-galactosidase, partial [Christensenellaceae bacterium]|jgi:beta-galactosidase|nr:beta-galactosidase [Christensenellaceae bacterium]